MPVELALDLVALALYDIVIYADDSTSMKYAENGSRIDDMKVVLERVTEVATLFDEDGMEHSLALFRGHAYHSYTRLHLPLSCQQFGFLSVCAVLQVMVSVPFAATVCLTAMIP